MDGSKERPKVTAGVDLGDNYSYLCLIVTQSGEVIEEGRLRSWQNCSIRLDIEDSCYSPECVEEEFREVHLQDPG